MVLWVTDYALSTIRPTAPGGDGWRDFLPGSEADYLAFRGLAPHEGAGRHAQPKRKGAMPLGKLKLTGLACHGENRLFEWMTSAMMLGIALVVLIYPLAIARGNFNLLLQAGITREVIGPTLFVFGMVRMTALYLNGVWQPHGPRLRAMGALIAALIWGQLCVALAMSSGQTGALSMGVPVYFMLTIGELISCYRAAVDVRNKHP